MNTLDIEELNGLLKKKKVIKEETMSSDPAVGCISENQDDKDEDEGVDEKAKKKRRDGRAKKKQNKKDVSTVYRNFLVTP